MYIINEINWSMRVYSAKDERKTYTMKNLGNLFHFLFQTENYGFSSNLGTGLTFIVK